MATRVSWHVFIKGGVKAWCLTGKIEGRSVRGCQRYTYINNFNIIPWCLWNLAWNRLKWHKVVCQTPYDDSTRNNKKKEWHLKQLQNLWPLFSDLFVCIMKENYSCLVTGQHLLFNYSIQWPCGVSDYFQIVLHNLITPLQYLITF